MCGNDLRNQFGDGRASLEFCSVGISLRDITFKTVFTPELHFLFNPKAALPDAKPVDVPCFENEARIGQHPSRSDPVDSRIEVERRRRHRRIEAPRKCDDAFHRRPGDGLIACRCRRQPQHCCGCSNCSEPSDSDRADHGVALRTSLLSTVPVSP